MSLVERVFTSVGDRKDDAKVQVGTDSDTENGEYTSSLMMISFNKERASS